MENCLRCESLTTAAAGLFEFVVQRVEGLDGDVLQTDGADVGHHVRLDLVAQRGPRVEADLAAVPTRTALALRLAAWQPLLTKVVGDGLRRGVDV